MQIGTILVVLSLSMVLATYILRPFLSKDRDLESVIDARVAELRDADGDSPQVHFCTQCGHQLADGDRFCAQCGHPVAGEK
jgi:predicted amidophosphoribosyltransferase